MSRSNTARAIPNQEQEIHELYAQIDTLNGILSAHGMPTLDQPPEWAKSLTPQQRAFMGLLIGAAPKAVSRWEILDRLPCLDHAVERSPMLVNVIVMRIRKLLGVDCIETVEGGYRLSDVFSQSPSSYRGPASV